MADSTLELVPVARPNGKVYKPRKPPRAIEVDNSNTWGEPENYIYVLGTHDIDAAYALAQHWKVDYDSGERSWTRLTMRRGEQVYEYDDISGMPAVIFEVVD